MTRDASAIALAGIPRAAGTVGTLAGWLRLAGWSRSGQERSAAEPGRVSLSGVGLNRLKVFVVAGLGAGWQGWRRSLGRGVTRESPDPSRECLAQDLSVRSGAGVDPGPTPMA